MTDIHQTRYLAHQDKKKRQLAYSEGTEVSSGSITGEIELLGSLYQSRRSQRMYASRSVDDESIDKILELATLVPSSCAREAIYSKVIHSRDEKELLAGLMVGGVGWMHRADTIILLFASKDAYKSPDERDFMPYLDAGAVMMNMYLTATALDLGVCFVNPNIRESNKPIFNKEWNEDDDYFCGAITIGHYDVKCNSTTKKENICLK